MKRVIIILLGAILLVGCVQYEDGEPVKDEKQEEKKVVAVAQKEQESTEQKKKDETAKENTIKVDEEIELSSLNFKVKTITIEDDKATIPIWWNHWAGNEKIHLTVLAYPVVKQGDDELEMIGGEDSLLRKTAKGVDSRVEVEYQLIDDETPITITMKTTSDNPEEESITIDIK